MAKFLNKATMDPDSSSVYMDNPGKPAMGEAAKAAKASPKKEMPRRPEPAKAGKRAMRKFDAQARRTSAKAQPAGELPAQGSSTARASGGESYLRLRVRVENGVMSVVDAKDVPGPLLKPEAIRTGYAAELILDDQSVAVESIPDLGERRPYFDPATAASAHAPHGSQPVSRAEFALRIPGGAISARTLPRAEIVLYEVKDLHEPLRTQGIRTLGAEFSRDTREVARLKGIKLDALPKAARDSIKRTMK